MEYHSGRKRLVALRLIQVTHWVRNLSEIQFAIDQLGKIPHVILSRKHEYRTKDGDKTITQYALFRKWDKSIFAPAKWNGKKPLSQSALLTMSPSKFANAVSLILNDETVYVPTRGPITPPMTEEQGVKVLRDWVKRDKRNRN